MRDDLDRFRRELGVDYIDVVLIHCVTDADWTTRYRGVMDVLSEAKQKGIIRAHGVSCHSFSALKAAAASPWVEVDLVRLNPIGSHMDAKPEAVIPVIKQMREQGKGIVGMKILGQGDLRDKPAEAIRYALGTGVLDAFTIGAESGARAEGSDPAYRSSMSTTYPKACSTSLIWCPCLHRDEEALPAAAGAFR